MSKNLEEVHVYIYIYEACNRYEEKLSVIVMHILLHKYMESNPHLPALCVCQMESASPQTPGITKNTINCFLARCQSSIATRAAILRAVATMKSVGLPTRLPRTPLIGEPMVLATPKQIMVYPIHSIPISQFTYA